MSRNDGLSDLLERKRGGTPADTSWGSQYTGAHLLAAVCWLDPLLQSFLTRCPGFEVSRQTLEIPGQEGPSSEHTYALNPLLFDVGQGSVCGSAVSAPLPLWCSFQLLNLGFAVTCADLKGDFGIC